MFLLVARVNLPVSRCDANHCDLSHIPVTLDYHHRKSPRPMGVWSGARQLGVWPGARQLSDVGSKHSGLFDADADTAATEDVRGKELAVAAGDQSTADHGAAEFQGGAGFGCGSGGTGGLCVETSSPPNLIQVGGSTWEPCVGLTSLGR